MEKSVLVVGAGISGIQAALDLAEAGVNVYLVEKAPSIGGRMAQFDKIYPTLENSLEILMPKMIEVAERQNIRLLTNTEVVSVEGSLGNFKVKILRKPRYVEENKCIGCGDCVKVCPVSMPDKFNEGLNQTKAISIYSPNAVPKLAIINPDYCLQLSGKEKCAKCVEACEAKA
ncbi:MAG: FAD-dependent oxidoreductase, partial [Candidatus Bathyarchaeia archaeon]